MSQEELAAFHERATKLEAELATIDRVPLVAPVLLAPALINGLLQNLARPHP